MMHLPITVANPEEGNSVAELSQHVLSFLSPEDLAQKMRLTKEAQALFSDEFLWFNKIKLHFPYATNIPPHGRYKEFRRLHKLEYSQVKEAWLRTFISLIKEHHTTGLANHPKFVIQIFAYKNILDTEIKLTSLKHPISLLELIAKEKLQSILDIIFQQISKQYRSQATKLTDPSGRSLLEWAAL